MKALERIFPKGTRRRRLLWIGFYLTVALMNFLVNFTPFFCVKWCVLRLFGIKIHWKAGIHRGIAIFSLGRLCIGKHSIVNHGCVLDNRGSIVIGENVSIAHNSKIYTAGHDVQDPTFPVITASVNIGDYACIYANSMIMPGVKIGKGAVVYPGSIVTKSVGEFEMVAGVPARVVGMRRRELDYTIDAKLWFSN